MSLRISEIIDDAGTTLRVDGRLLRTDIPELVRAIADVVPPLTLDLAGLLFADAEGVGALNQIRARGASLRNVPPYVSLLLRMQPTRGDSHTAGAARAAAVKIH
jgi:hypothetical protein